MHHVNCDREEQNRPSLPLFHFLRQLAKLLGLFVTRFQNDERAFARKSSIWDSKRVMTVLRFPYDDTTDGSQH